MEDDSRLNINLFYGIPDSAAESGAQLKVKTKKDTVEFDKGPITALNPLLFEIQCAHTG